MDIGLEQVVVSSDSPTQGIGLERRVQTPGKDEQPKRSASRPASSAEQQKPAAENASLREESKEEKHPEKPIWLGDKTFKCGDPYEVPYPQVDGDPWEKVYGFVKDHDDTMCDAWMDEIQNLLILAGLFSAIVTAFVIETQKLLQEDPATTSALFLVHIASQLAINGSSLQGPLPATTLQPLDRQSLAHAFRINCFLFLSLIVSLATALFGILVMQWIRSYRKRETLSYQDLMGLRQSRYAALMKWKVPEIVSALPILLQLGLVVFFVGLVDFLHFLYPKLSIVIGVFVACVILVLVLTTILPSLILLDVFKFNFAYRHTEFLSRHTVYWYSRSNFLGAQTSHFRDWTDVVRRRSPFFSKWVPISLSWVLQNFNNSAEPLWVAYNCFRKLKEPADIETVLKALDRLPDNFWHDIGEIEAPNFKEELLSTQLLYIVLRECNPMARQALLSHYAECYLRCRAEIEAVPSLEIVSKHLYRPSTFALSISDMQCISKVHRRHLWYFECSLVKKRFTDWQMWQTFWFILESEWDDVTVITLDEALSLVFKPPNSWDAGDGATVVRNLSSLLRFIVTDTGFWDKILYNLHFLACLDFFITDDGRELLCRSYFGVYGKERWASLMQEYKLDDKYAALLDIPDMSTPTFDM